MFFYHLLTNVFATWLGMIAFAMIVAPLIPSLRQFIDGGKGHKTHNLVAGYFLLIFGGLFGVHRFYYGHRKVGVAYLCTLGICGLGVLFDLLYLPFLNKKVSKTSTPGGKSFSMAFFLLFFGGFLSALHRFYLGMWVKGLALASFSFFIFCRTCAITQSKLAFFQAWSSKATLFDGLLALVAIFIWGREYWGLYNHIEAINRHNELYEFAKKVVHEKKKKVTGHIDVYSSKDPKLKSYEYALVRLKEW